MAETSVSGAPSRGLQIWMPLFVLAAASVLAGNLLYLFWDRADHLWYSLHHDRNVHYLQGLAIGLSVRNLDIVSLFRELERIQTWGVLHPLLEGVVQLAAGPDHRLAVLPSLIGWVGCAAFGFLLARRMAPRFGNLAGLVTAAFVLASPAHHAFATDIMLESLGACLSLAVLYFYMAYVQEDSRRAGVRLGVCWALLFFCKANYWLLATAALVLAEIVRHRAALRAFAQERRAEIAPTLLRQLYHPLTWLIAAPGLAGIYLWKVGPITVSLGSTTLTIRAFHGLVHLAFACLCLRLYLWWRRGGRDWLATWPDSQRMLLLTATLPVACWFLLPKRLGSFLWFVSPANNSQPIEKYVPFYGFTHYWQGFLDDYSTAAWLAWLVVALTAVTFLCAPRLMRGAGAVLLFVVIATTLTMHHPMLKYRHMHSWVAFYWVTAGVGAALMLTALARVHEHLARGVAGAAVVALALYLAPAFVAPGHAQESGVRPHLPTFLEITRAFEPHVDPSHRVQILCSQIESHGLRWVYLEKVPRPRMVGMDIPGFNLHSHDPQAIRKWLKNTKADALVLVDIGANSRFACGLPPLPFKVLEESLREHGVFECARHWDVAPGERVSLWTRTNVAQSER